MAGGRPPSRDSPACRPAPTSRERSGRRPSGGAARRSPRRRRRTRRGSRPCEQAARASVAGWRPRPSGRSRPRLRSAAVGQRSARDGSMTVRGRVRRRRPAPRGSLERCRKRRLNAPACGRPPSRGMPCWSTALEEHGTGSNAMRVAASRRQRRRRADGRERRQDRTATLTPVVGLSCMDRSRRRRFDMRHVEVQPPVPIHPRQAPVPRAPRRKGRHEVPTAMIYMNPGRCSRRCPREERNAILCLGWGDDERSWPSPASWSAAQALADPSQQRGPSACATASPRRPTGRS